MNLKHFLLSALAVIAVAAGCKKEGVPTGDPSISLSEKRLPMSKDADSKSVNLTSNREWKAKVDDAAKEWLHVTPESGVASANAIQITVSCDANESDERTGKVTFSTGTASTTLTVKQEAAKPTVYAKCSDIRALAQGTVIEDGTFVNGQVVSNADLDNLTNKKSMYIQDVYGDQAGKPGSGLQVRFAAEPSVKLGDIVKVNLSGMKMSAYDGALQIDANGKAAADVVIVLEEGAELLPLEISIDDLLANKYEDQYVTIKEEVQVVSADLEKKWYSSSAHTSINIETADAKSFVVFTSKYATALDKTVAQGSGNICGVASINKGTVQLFFAKATDADDLIGERFSADVKTVSIDEALTMSGSKVNVIGRVIGVCPQGVIINDGTQNNIYVYVDDSDLNFVEDDIISVTGKLTTYNKLVEFSNPDEVVESSEEVKETPAQGETEITAANVDTWVPSPAGSARVSMQGVLRVVSEKEKEYFNVEIDGATIKGSVIAESDMVKDFDGKYVEVAGFWAGTSDKFFSIVLRSITESGAPYLTISPATLTVNSNATTASFSISSNTHWIAESQTEGFDIDITEGEGDATIKVNFTENETTEPRIATIKVSATEENIIDKVFTLTQKEVSDVVTLTFPDDNKENNKVSAYDKEWEATINGQNFTIKAFNNNNWKNDWTFIRCGRKGNASVASIATTIATPISKIVVTVDDITASNVNSIKLTAGDMEVAATALEKGNMTFEVPDPADDLTYTLTFDCKSGSGNGFVQISKIEYQPAK